MLQSPDTISASQSRILVVLPPWYKSPDLDRLLTLARKAFSAVTLNLFDLNLRFAWVGADELSKSNHFPLPPPPPQAPSCLTPQHPGPPPLIQDAPQNSYRVFVTNLLPTLSDHDILSLVPFGTKLAGATLYPPRPTGPHKELVRSVMFGFRRANLAKRCYEWIKEQGTPEGRELARYLIRGTRVNVSPPIPAVYAVQREDVGEAPTYGMVSGCHAFEDTGACRRQGEGDQIPSSHSRKQFAPLPLYPSPLTTTNTKPPLDPLPPNTNPLADALPSPLPEASPDHFRLHISNLHPDLPLATLLASLLPPGLTPSGATLYPPRSLGAARRDPVRLLKLAFAFEAEANACHAWIKQQAVMHGGGVVGKLVGMGAKVGVGNVMAPMVDGFGSEEAEGGPHDAMAHRAAHPQRSLPALSTASLSVSVTGIDPSAPVKTVLGLLLGSGHHPVRVLQTGLTPMGDTLEGGSLARGLRFVFDSVEEARRFAERVCEAEKDGQFAGIVAKGWRVRVGAG